MHDTGIDTSFKLTSLSLNKHLITDKAYFMHYCDHVNDDELAKFAIKLRQN